MNSASVRSTRTGPKDQSRKKFMKNYLRLSTVLGLLAAAGSGTLFAADITVADGSLTSTIFGTDTRGLHEDNETEGNTVGSQVWDLEAFVVKGSKLYVIGG